MSYEVTPEELLRLSSDMKFGLFWCLLLIILSDAGIYGQQLVNIALRSKGDPPQSLQQKLRNAFASSNTHDNDVQQKDNNILHASVEDNAEEKIDYGDDEYIVQFYPSQVESIEQSDEGILVIEDNEPWHPTPFRTTPLVKPELQQLTGSATADLLLNRKDESSDVDLEATLDADPEATGLSVTIDDRTFNIFVKGAARKAAQLGRDAVDVAAEFVQNSLRKTFDKHRKPLIDLDDLNLFKYLPKQNDGYEVYEVMSKPHIRQDEPSHYAPTPTIAPAVTSTITPTYGVFQEPNSNHGSAAASPPRGSSNYYGTNFQDAQQNNNNYVRNSNHHHSRPPPSQTTTYKPATSFKNAAQNKFKSFFKSNKKPKKPIIHTTTTTTTATTTATSFKNNNPFLKTPVPVYLKSTTPPLYRPKRNKLRPGSAPTLSGTFAPTTPRPPPLPLTPSSSPHSHSGQAAFAHTTPTNRLPQRNPSPTPAAITGPAQTLTQKDQEFSEVRQAWLNYLSKAKAYSKKYRVRVDIRQFKQPKNRRKSHSKNIRPHALPPMKSIKQPLPTKFPRNFQRKPVLVTPKPAFHPNPFSGIQRLQLPFKSRSPSKASIHRVTKMPYFTIGHVPMPVTAKGFSSSQDYASSINNPEILKPGDAIELDSIHAPVDSMVSPSNYLFEAANDYNENIEDDYFDDNNENEEYYNDYERFLVDYTDAGNYNNIEINGSE